jgi:hypothetical protein
MQEAKENPEICASCSYETKRLKFYKGGGGGFYPDRWLCEICATTYIGNKTVPKSPDENKDLYIVIAQVGNMILEEIRKKKPA